MQAQHIIPVVPNTVKEYVNRTAFDRLSKLKGSFVLLQELRYYLLKVHLADSDLELSGKHFFVCVHQKQF